MKILSIDTASDICGVSILENNNLIKQSDISTGRTHSENLMPQVQNIFTDTNLSLKDIDLIVTNIGPGSFTGIRIGISTVKAFIDTHNINSIGVSSLESLVYNTENIGYIVSLIPATNDDFYFSIYKKSESNLDLIIEPCLNSFSNIINICSKYLDTNITFIGTDLTNRKNEILNIIPNSTFSSENENILNSYSLALAGLYKFNNNNLQDITPLYIKKPQAQIELENKMKGLN